MSDSAIKLTNEDMVRETARRYLADRAYLSVLGKPQSAKLRQVVKAVEIEGVTPRLMRDVMSESDRFESIDRRWAAAVRFGDLRKPFERVLIETVQAAGVPVNLETLAEEMAAAYSRSVEHFEQVVPRFLSNKDRFFIAKDNFGLADWLVIPTSEDEADVVFDNFISEEQVAHFAEICPAIEWDVENLADGAAKVITGCAEPVPFKVLALMAWRSLAEDFDPVDFYSAVLDDERLLVLSDQKIYPAEITGDLLKSLSKIAEELAALPMEAEEEEAEGPVTVTETDHEEIIDMILDKGSATAGELLEAVLEVAPEESAYAGALESLREALKEDDRIMWLGEDRWGKLIVFPEDVKVVPDSLVVPAGAPFETPEGDIFDQELEIEGFEGDLKSAIYDPLAEDVTDEDPSLTNYQPNGDSQRGVLKYHHKVEGTFPLGQINPDFFGTEPEIIPIVLIDEGKRKNVYVNNSTRLMYGLKDFYKSITEISGAAFYIEKTAKPGEFRFRYEGENDGQLHIDTGRSLELLDLKARFESTEMPLYDVVKEILSKQGMTFAQIVNEVNIVKRTSRLLVASILSSYHAFHTRGKSEIWQFDAKKESQGFNKAKKKYVKKD